MAEKEAQPGYKAPTPVAPAATKSVTKTTKVSPVATAQPNLVVVAAPAAAKPGTVSTFPAAPAATRNITNRYP